jgi:hypothetical protein
MPSDCGCVRPPAGRDPAPLQDPPVSHLRLRFSLLDASAPAAAAALLVARYLPLRVEFDLRAGDAAAAAERRGQPAEWRLDGTEAGPTGRENDGRAQKNRLIRTLCPALPDPLSRPAPEFMPKSPIKPTAPRNNLNPCNTNPCQSPSSSSRICFAYAHIHDCRLECLPWARMPPGWPPASYFARHVRCPDYPPC